MTSRLTPTHLETLAAVLYNATECVLFEKAPEQIKPFGLQSRVVQRAYRQAAEDAVQFVMNAQSTRELRLAQLVEELFQLAEPGPVKASLWQAYLAVKKESEEKL